MKDNISPEEKLLRLIKGKKASKEEKDKAPQAISASVNKGAPTTSLDKQNYGLLQSASLFRKFSFETVTSYFNMLLALFLVMSLIFLGYILIRPLYTEKISEPLSTAEAIDASDTTEEAIKKEALPLSYYQEQINKRDIFIPLAASQENALEAPAVLENLMLMGIVMDEKPQAVISDTKNNKTYFLNQGDYINQIIKVEEINKDRVILNYQGQKFELFL